MCHELFNRLFEIFPEGIKFLQNLTYFMNLKKSPTTPLCTINIVILTRVLIMEFFSSLIALLLLLVSLSPSVACSQWKSNKNHKMFFWFHNSPIIVPFISHQDFSTTYDVPYRKLTKTTSNKKRRYREHRKNQNNIFFLLLEIFMVECII